MVSLADELRFCLMNSSSHTMNNFIHKLTFCPGCGSVFVDFNICPVLSALFRRHEFVNQLQILTIVADVAPLFGI